MNNFIKGFLTCVGLFVSSGLLFGDATNTWYCIVGLPSGTIFTDLTTGEQEEGHTFPQWIDCSNRLHAVEKAKSMTVNDIKGITPAMSTNGFVAVIAVIARVEFGNLDDFEVIKEIKVKPNEVAANELPKKLANESIPDQSENKKQMSDSEKPLAEAGKSVESEKVSTVQVEAVEISAISNNPVKTVEFSFEYTVKNGDTMGTIAYRHGCTIRKLKKFNNLKDISLKIGQKLMIPVLIPADSAETTYIVQEGETLMQIARDLGVTPGVIRELNNLGENDEVNAGQVLKLPPEKMSK